MVTSWIFLGALSQAVVLAPQVEPGRVQRTEVRVKQEYLMESFVEQVGDQSRSQGASGAISTEEFVAFEDRYLDPLVVKRHFEEIEFGSKSVMTTARGDQRTEHLKFASLFESYDVLFTWIEAENEYARRYHEIGSSEEPLRDLYFEADGRTALPADPVAVGARWELDGPAIARLVAPGGDLALRPEERSILGRSIKMGVGASLAELFDETSLGRAVCDLVELRAGDDGAELAVIAISDLSLQAVVDQTREYERLMTRQEKREPAFLEGAIADVQLLNGHGELVWNVTSGRLETMNLQADQNLVLTVQKQFGEAVEGEEGMQAFTRIQSVAYKGLLTLDVRSSELPE